jgi:hypothetical protein
LKRFPGGLSKEEYERMSVAERKAANIPDDGFIL